MKDLIKIAFTLFLIMDPLGNIPSYLSVLRHVPKDRQRPILIRELFIAFAFLLVFALCGSLVLDLFGFRQESVLVSGGVVLLLIAIKMVFPSGHGVIGDVPSGEPLIVPLAVPLVAGPSALATLLIYSHNVQYSPWQIVGGLSIAWVASAGILISAPSIFNLIGERGAAAMERLMGLVLTIVAVQMLIDGFIVIRSTQSG